ncbi:hypothetical protein AMTRI_Chr01g134910 [Amborella trichopoda]
MESSIPKVSINSFEMSSSRARRIVVGSFCPPLEDYFGLNDWTKQGWNLPYVPEERFYRVRGSLMTLMVWSPTMHPPFAKKELFWVLFWGIPLHVWDVSVLKGIANAFGEFCAANRNILEGPYARSLEYKFIILLGFPGRDKLDCNWARIGF